MNRSARAVCRCPRLNRLVVRVTHPPLLTLAAVILAASASLPTMAVQPETWTHTAEADFADGDFDATVATNLGDVQLAMRSRPVVETLEPATVVYALLALPDGSTLLAVGPEARLLRHDGDELTELLTLPGEQVFSLALFNGKPLAAISGPRPRLAVLDGPDMNELTVIAELPTTEPPAVEPADEDEDDAGRDPEDGLDHDGADSTPDGGDNGTQPAAPEPSADSVAAMTREDAAAALRYVWDMIVDSRHIYLATGPGGRVLRVDLSTATPTVQSLLDTGQNNVLCLTRDALGRLFAGTDGEGLVLRIDDPRAPLDAIASFVAYDAAEPEIAALLAASDGNLYIGTADAEQARPGRLERPGEQPVGRDAGPQQPALSPQPQEPPDAAALPPQPTDAADSPDDREPGGPQELQEVSPTPQQRDALRAVIRQRLLDARRSGAVRPDGGQRAPTRAATGQPPARERALRAGGPPQPPVGNAVYRLDSDGFVSEVMRESVMILALVEEPRADDDQPLSLLAATGNEGQLFRLTPRTGEVARLAKLEAEQITTLLRRARDGQGVLLAATANPAKLLAIDGERAAEGRFTSRPLDAGQIALWGMMHVTATTPPGAAVAVQTRSGNVSQADDRFWSPWTEPVTLEAAEGGPLAPRVLRVDSPPARFVQYRLVLRGDGRMGPGVGQVQLTRVVPNLRPSIKSLTTKYAADRDESAGPKPQFNLELEWEAADANNDKLTYSLEYRPADAEAWLPLAEDIAETRFTWDTRRAPDGRYIVRLTASDSPDNPGVMALSAVRLSDPVVVDNTPPHLENAPAVSRVGEIVTITAAFRDDLSPIREVRYGLNATDDFQPVLPDDLIYDSTRESVTVRITDLSPGPHVVVLRATDAQGNALLHALDIPAR